MGFMSTASSGSSGTPTKVEDADANTKIQVEEGSDENKIRFDTAGTERMIIDENGKVGIGVAAPSAPLHVKSDDAITGLAAHVIIESTDDDGAHGPVLNLFRNSASPADNDHIGMIRFTGQNSNGDEHMYAQIFVKATDVSNTTEDADLRLQAIHAGSETGRIDIGADITVNGNLVNSDFMVHGDSQVYVLFVDAGQDSVGIRTGNPVATLDVASGQTFRNTRLLTVSVSSGTTLTEAAHAGRYNICAGNVTLPSTSTAGEHYAILNTTGGDITIGRNGNNINGAGSDFTLGTYKAATCIAIGSNNWMVVG